MQYASCIMHECIICNKIINALSKIYFALKNDTPQGYYANSLFLHNALCMIQYASCIMHECIMCNKIIKALSKIYFALKKDTPQGYNANNLFLHNAFAYTCMHACTFYDACMQLMFLCIDGYTVACIVMLK